MQEFDFGRVISRIFDALRQNFKVLAVLPLTTIGLISLIGTAYITGITLQMFSGIDIDNPASIGGQANNFGTLMSYSFIFMILYVIVVSMLQGAMIYASVKSFNNETAGLGDSIRVGLRYALPLIGVGILAGLGIVFGMLLLIVPGLILMCIWAVIGPAIVIENTGVGASFERSSQLTSGYRWQIFGLFILYAIASTVVSGIADALFSPIDQYAILSGESLNASSTSIFIYAFVTAIVQALSSMIATIGVASLYFELRHVRDGSSPESLAAVFD